MALYGPHVLSGLHVTPNSRRLGAGCLATSCRVSQLAAANRIVSVSRPCKLRRQAKPASTTVHADLYESVLRPLSPAAVSITAKLGAPTPASTRGVSILRAAAATGKGGSPVSDTSVGALKAPPPRFPAAAKRAPLAGTEKRKTEVEAGPSRAEHSTSVSRKQGEEWQKQQLPAGLPWYH